MTGRYSRPQRTHTFTHTQTYTHIHALVAAVLPWVVGAVLSVNVEFFTL